MPDEGIPEDVQDAWAVLFTAVEAAADLLDGRGVGTAPPPPLSESVRYATAAHLRHVSLEVEKRVIPAAIAGQKRSTETVRRRTNLSS